MQYVASYHKLILNLKFWPDSDEIFNCATYNAALKSNTVLLLALLSKGNNPVMIAQLGRLSSY